MKTVFTLLLALSLFGCSTDKGKLISENDAGGTVQSDAKVSKVESSGEVNAYTFEVTVESPDTGCDQYADWWEVVDLEGHLIFRRILAHSHVNDQPFTRTGGAVEIAEDQEVYVRVHMNNSGYASQGQKGTVANGFQATELEADFAEDLAESDPLPNGCAF